MDRYRPINSPKNDRKSPTLPVIEEEEEAAAVTRIVLLKRTFLPVGSADASAGGDQDFFAKIEQKRMERFRTFHKAPAAAAAAKAAANKAIPKRLRPKSQSPRALDVLALRKLTLHAKGEGYHKRLEELQAKVRAWCCFKTSKLSKPTQTEAARGLAATNAATFDRLDFTRLLSSVLEITYLDDALDIRNLVFRDKSVSISQEKLDVYLKPVLEWEALFGAGGISRRHVPRRPSSHLSLLLEASLNECKPVTPDILSAASEALLEDSDAGAGTDENDHRLNAIDKIVIRETRHADAFQPLPTIRRAAWLAYYYTLKSIPIGSVRPPAHQRTGNNAKSPRERRSRQRIVGTSDTQFFWTENADRNQVLPRMSWMKVVAFLRVDWLRSPGAFEDINLCKEHLMPPPSGTCFSMSRFEEFIKTAEFFLNYRRSLNQTHTQATLRRPSKMTLAALPATRLRIADLADLVNTWEARANEFGDEDGDRDEDEAEIAVEVEVDPPILLQELTRRVDLETKTLSIAEWLSSIYSIHKQTTFAM